MDKWHEVLVLIVRHHELYTYEVHSPPDQVTLCSLHTTLLR